MDNDVKQTPTQDSASTQAPQNQTPTTSEKDFPPAAPEIPPNSEHAKQESYIHKHKRFLIWDLVALLVVAAALVMVWWLGHHDKPAAVNLNTTSSKSNAPQTSSTSTSTNSSGQLVLNASKNYGNKYKDGVLSVGDGKYTTSSAKQGYVYACGQYAQNLASSQGGAMTQGPWFMDGGKEYNVSKKLHVEGSVHWTGKFTDIVSGNTRTITSNDLPLSDPTGIFPIESTDPAYQYDHNPNSIESQNFTYAIAANPVYHSTPNCESGQVGVMLTGVALFNALDAGGRDAGAWEVQDECDGHPQEQGVYHYHTLSSCIKNASVHTVIGFALDGYPITGPTVSQGNILTTADLDECHGIVSQITLDGKSVTMYHYVMTEDFPYSVSCFRGTPISPPGQKANAQANQQGQIPNQRPRP